MAAADVGAGTAASALAHPAFAALMPWLEPSDADDAGAAGVDALTLDRLNSLAARCEPPPAAESGATIRFVAPGTQPPAVSLLSYESRILSTGEVATRPGNRHDIFNALCWIAFPRVKRACNALHVAHAAAEARRRGPVRDALTLFDESGVIALCADPALGEQLATRQWKLLFSARRDAAIRALRFFVCGHALYEKLLDPYPGITGRVLIVPIAPALLECPAAMQREFADADAVNRLRALRSTADIPPLPLAGIPGWDSRNENPDFYDDASVFRQPRA